MTDGQTWALVALVVGALWLALRFVRAEREGTRRQQRLEQLHRERMAALERGIALPEEPSTESAPGPWAPSWDRLMLGLGLILLCAGIGFMVGIRLVPRTPETLGLRELATLGLIPAMVGGGLVLYWFLLDRWGGEAR